MPNEETNGGLEINDVCEFKLLEAFLNRSNNVNISLKVLDVTNNQTAIMHTFKSNFAGDYRSGDGVLFYDDGETHSAEPRTKFKILEFIKI